MSDSTPYVLADALDGVRTYAQSVVDEDTCFTINSTKLKYFAGELADVESTESALVSNNLSTINQKLYFMLYFGVANFSYVNPLTGSDYIYTRNKTGEILHRTGGFIAALLSLPVVWDQPESILSLTDKEWREGLQLDVNDLYLANKRIESIRTLAWAIEAGELLGIDEQEINANLLFESLMRTGLFQDYFLKRIQIVLYFLHLIAKHQGVSFAPQPLFTAMADYRLPQALINAGVLEIDEATRMKLNAGVVFEKNERDEIALRAYTIIICAQLAQVMHITEAEVDGRIWAYAQKMLATRSDIVPAPRVATDCY